MGGIGLKKARLMNRALLAKLIQRVITKEGETWCKVLKVKYGSRRIEGIQFIDKQRASRVRKGIVWGPELLREGLRWSLGNGKCIRFWTYSWLDEKPLVKKSLSSNGG